MNHETLTFIFGALLLLIGILGGGFEVKELKVPKVGWSIRLISVIVGAFFIAMSLGFNVTILGRDTHKNGINAISELNSQIRDIDFQIQNLENDLASSKVSSPSSEELQDIRQELERHLAEIESRQATLKFEIDELRPHVNSDPVARKRIEQLEGEKIPNLEVEKDDVQRQLKELHDVLPRTEQNNELMGEINTLKKEKRSLQERVDHLKKQLQPTVNSRG